MDKMLVLVSPFARDGWWAMAGAAATLAAGVILYGWRRGEGRGSESYPGELAMLRAVVASLPDLIYVKDRKSRFLLANQATADAMGASSGAELLGKSDFDYYPPEMADGFYQDEQKIIETGKPLVSQDEHVRDPQGRALWILTTKVPFREARGGTVGIIGIGRNITGLKETETELLQARENLHFRATHDGLTSLLNREAILEMLEREMARGARENHPAAVLLADLDHFKQVNDRFGHPVGDEVLRETGRRFQRAVRSYDLVGRYGGEEFLILLGGCPGEEALPRAEQLRQAMEAEPVMTTRGPVRLTISMGVLPAREWGYPSAEEVLREVDIALYAAKAGGRNRCKLAAPPLLTLDE